jgi:hypothetical protein
MDVYTVIANDATSEYNYVVGTYSSETKAKAAIFEYFGSRAAMTNAVPHCSSCIATYRCFATKIWIALTTLNLSLYE